MFLRNGNPEHSAWAAVDTHCFIRDGVGAAAPACIFRRIVHDFCFVALVAGGPQTLYLERRQQDFHFRCLVFMNYCSVDIMLVTDIVMTNNFTLVLIFLSSSLVLHVLDFSWDKLLNFPSTLAYFLRPR